MAALAATKKTPAFPTLTQTSWIALSLVSLFPDPAWMTLDNPRVPFVCFFVSDWDVWLH